MRKQLGGPLHVDLCSVWTFAGALVLPPVLAVGVAVVVHTHLWWRSWRPRLPLYKQLFSTSTVVLACLAAGAVGAVARPGEPGLLGDLGVVTIVLALLAYVVVNSALVAAAIMMSAPEPDVAAALGEWDDNALEFATLVPRRAHRDAGSSSTRTSRCSRCPPCCSCTAPCWCATWSRPPTPTTRPACSPRPRGTPAPSACSRGPPRLRRRCS